VSLGTKSLYASQPVTLPPSSEWAVCPWSSVAVLTTRASYTSKAAVSLRFATSVQVGSGKPVYFTRNSRLLPRPTCTVHSATISSALYSSSPSMNSGCGVGLSFAVRARGVMARTSKIKDKSGETYYPDLVGECLYSRI